MLSQEWLSQGHNTSPVTRQPLTSQQLTPNYALKSLIEEYKGGAIPQAAHVHADPVAAQPAPPIRIAASRIRGTKDCHVTLTVDDTPAAALPTLFIDVLDISGYARASQPS